jgi:chemotaxis protein methyltransferase CheR
VISIRDHRVLAVSDAAAALLDFVRRRTGLALTETGRPAAAIRRAMARVTLRDPDKYRELVESDAALFDDLLAELTVGESYFLRERGQFDFIGQEVIPEIRRRRGAAHVIQAWSAGCAAGEEAYSLAILADQTGARDSIRVLGTDIARERLEVARRGVYGNWSLRGVPADVMGRYFRQRGRHVEVAPEIRSAVEFRHLNLVDEDWHAAGVESGRMDLVLCRNVLIYFDPAAIARVARRLVDSLSDEGWLFLGASDPILTDIVPCDVVVTGAGIAYRRKPREHGASVPRRRINDTEWGNGARALAPIPARPDGDASAIKKTITPLPVESHTASARRLEQSFAEIKAAYGSADYVQGAVRATQYVAENADDAAGWILLVRSLANLGRLEEAGVACAAGLDRHRTSAELTYLHALLLRESGNTPEAVAALRRALYLDQRFVPAHLALGDLFAARGEFDAASRSFRNAERLLQRCAEGELPPGADGLDAARLLQMTRMRLQVARRSDGQ